MRGQVAKAAVQSALTFQLLEFFDAYRGFGPSIVEGFREERVLFLVTASILPSISTGTCGVACPLLPSGVDKPLI